MSSENRAENSTRERPSRGDYRGRQHGGYRGRGRRHGNGSGDRPRVQNQSPRPTHFISLPIGHHSTLRNVVQAFYDALMLPSNTPVQGIDQSILIHPRRLHFTLGVMTLSRNGAQPSESQEVKTVDSALTLLKSLEPRVKEILNSNRLEVKLDRMDIMDPRRDEARVLWLGPSLEGEGGRRLKDVCDYVHGEFKRAGYITDQRPLKLHCTIINTSHRKPFHARRIPFSYSELLGSTAVQSIRLGDDQPVTVDFGTHTVDEIQLCEMGSWGPEKEYVSDGGINLKMG